MSNNFGQKSEFIPAIYTRYFERSETSKSSSLHTRFNDDYEEASKNYQIKRDSLFKRLFPSRYSDSNNDHTDEKHQITQNGNIDSLNKSNQSLGDFIPLSSFNSPSSDRKQSLSSSSLQHDIIETSSDDNEEEFIKEHTLPTMKHESIVGHVHPRTAIEHVRSILIRELYQRTSEASTEWLKCKMGLPREYINPKYYADFQRRYRKEIRRNSLKKKRSSLKEHNSDDNHKVYDLTANDDSTIELNSTLESDQPIEISPMKSVKPTSPSSPIVISNDSPIHQASISEFIVLDSDDDNNESYANENLNENIDTTYFIDRSSNSFTTVSKPTVTSNEDYHKEDSKYDQLPTHSKTSESIIRPILSKHQRRKQSHSTKPLVSAIDKIIDQMDQSYSADDATAVEQQNFLVKQIKKRKKKKKKKQLSSTIN